MPLLCPSTTPLVSQSSDARNSNWWLRSHIAAWDELATAAGRLFEVVGSGAVKVDVGQSYALRDAAAAHRDLEARKTTGSTLLLP